MRVINTEQIKNCVKDMLLKANISIDEKYINYMKNAADAETNETAREILNILIENNNYAIEKQVPLCQDTGMAVIFLNIGQDVRIEGDYLYDAVNEGVR
ncbi:MAG: fumarate hydratase, partial [Eubacteriaceae bacterium]